MNHTPTIVLTGASGLIGRTLLDEWKNDFRIFAVARRTQQECEAPVHSNIAWMRADVSDHGRISEVFREIATAGGADFVFHLAAYYDFSGERHPEYYTTNVKGTQHVLGLSQDLHPRLFVFSSSVAACPFPAPNDAVREDTPPSGEHIYSWSKREGERLIMDQANAIRSCIVRLGAVYTDWCEYPPLYTLLQTWLGNSWKARILAGKGESAVPYIHMRDIISFFHRLIETADSLPQKTVLQACTTGSTSHRMLFQLATRHFYGEERQPIFMPAAAIVPGLHALRLAGKVTGNVPFEQPWMLRYVDEKLTVDASRTYTLLNWKPNPRHAIERRIRYLLEHLKAEPHLWNLKNLRASLKERDRVELRIYQRLLLVEDRVIAEAVSSIFDTQNAIRYASLRSMDRNELTWFVRMLFRLLLTSIHSGNTLLVCNYFEISSSGRFAAGYTPDDLIAVLRSLDGAILRDSIDWGEPRPPRTALHHSVTMPIELAIDEIEFQRESASSRQEATGREAPKAPTPDDIARRQLEETIWNCLVMRK
ncbi:MAG TPA: NAD(P)-dependent oxidoreductase [Bacteroidota bacterium]|nr:NAD(P)-dependent oxidoreductase [Bacteroidota bacterium]